MIENQDWGLLDSIRSSIDEGSERQIKELDELRSHLEVISEDRARLKQSIESLLIKNSKIYLHYDLMKSLISKFQTQNTQLSIENIELKKQLESKDTILKNLKQLLNPLSPTLPSNQRNLSYNETNNSKRRRRPIGTFTPSGFSQSFYK
ncbi:hypothetical protein SteCoe_5853 [Stentor coeruleus]|uniref:Uncharacterized protein n=1 Tax=Stentor coeruleus TaxID=5963 RepID=A0A1R2CRH6_9CILI|nr:hypothetical protein SteCoe_5853 [Stentor coeruleus]